MQTFDPEAMEHAKAILPSKVLFCENPYQALEGADLLVIATEWNAFRLLDKSLIKKAMRKPLIFDGRNMYDPEEMKSLGFSYYSIGRS